MYKIILLKDETFALEFFRSPFPARFFHHNNSLSPSLSLLYAGCSTKGRLSMDTVEMRCCYIIPPFPLVVILNQQSSLSVSSCNATSRRAASLAQHSQNREFPNSSPVVAVLVPGLVWPGTDVRKVESHFSSPQLHVPAGKQAKGGTFSTIDYKKVFFSRLGCCLFSSAINNISLLQ